MRSSIRLWSRAALLAGLGIAQLTACSSDSRDRHAEDAQDTGTMKLALEAVSQSGNVYRLRNATFGISDRRTGDVVEFLSSESAPEGASQLSTILNSGNYVVELFDGWFLERVSNGDGTGGTAGVGTAGRAAGGGTGAVGQGGRFGGPGGGKTMPPLPFDPGFGEGGDSGDFGSAGDFGIGGEPSTGGFGGTAGSFPGGFGGTGGTTGGVVVEAQLVSDAIQPFTIEGGGRTFVAFSFRVGREIIDFDRGQVDIGIDVFEDPPLCEPPDGVINTGRVLLETNTDALSSIDLFGVLDALATNGGLSADALLLYQQLYDSYATADQARLEDTAHCGDEITDGVPTLNGFPITCNRREHAHFDDPDTFFPTAFVNRIDLAAANGAHCGQQRMIFASNSLGRAFIIFEAQIPNPAPELGVQGCAPIAEFWVNANAIDDPIERGQRLAAAFTRGVPELLEAGVGPFFTAQNLTAGSGQIRTNQFDDSPWTLREFKLAQDGENLRVIPLPVSESPPGFLWDEGISHPLGPACRENFLNAMGGLLTNDPAKMSFVVDEACKDAESRNDFSEDYPSFLSPGFSGQIADRFADSGLSPEDLANRAQFAGSCIGCHEEAIGRSLGQDVFAPSSNGFVHVSEFAGPCGSGNSGFCFTPSPALRDVFLPSRLQTMANLLGIVLEPNPCDDDGGGSGGSAGRGGVGPVPPRPGTSGPAPVVEIDLPAASTPVEEIQELDAEIREAYGDETLSGRSAQSTH